MPEMNLFMLEKVLRFLRNEETFVYGHFAMVMPTPNADFPNAWEILEVTKDKHHF